MSKNRTASILTVLLVAIGSGWFPTQRGWPGMPEQAFQPIQTPAARPASLSDRMVMDAQGNVRQQPENANAYAELAAAFMRKARETGDAAYYGRAQAACKKGSELAPSNYDVLRKLAWVENGLHEFEKSLALAEQARVRQPRDPWNYGLIGDALVELGRYEEAAVAIQKMVDLKPDTASYSRAAYLRELFGDPQGAIAIMHLAANAADGQDPEMVAWCLVQLGHLHLSIGQLKAAEQQYSAALQIFPHYFQALLGMGRVLAADKKFDKAIDFYRQSTAIVPQMEAVAELGDLLALLGRKEESERQYALIEVIEKLNRSHQVQPDAWLALFYADHGRRLDQAVAIAESQIARRKDIRTYDALAWVYYQAGRYAEADRAMDQALRLGTQNAGLLYHAGMIKARLGLNSAAIDFLQRALQVNSAFHPLHAGLALRAIEMLRLRAGLPADANGKKAQAGIHQQSAFANGREE